MRKAKPTVFVSQDYKYVCDSCDPLKKAISKGKSFGADLKGGCIREMKPILRNWKA